MNAPRRAPRPRNRAGSRSAGVPAFSRTKGSQPAGPPPRLRKARDLIREAADKLGALDSAEAAAVVAAELRDAGCTVRFAGPGIVAIEEPADADAFEARRVAIAGRGPAYAAVPLVVLRDISRLEPDTMAWAFLGGSGVPGDPGLMLQGMIEVASGTVARCHPVSRTSGPPHPEALQAHEDAPGATQSGVEGPDSPEPIEALTETRRAFSVHLPTAVTPLDSGCEGVGQPAAGAVNTPSPVPDSRLIEWHDPLSDPGPAVLREAAERERRRIEELQTQLALERLRLGGRSDV